MPFGDDGVPLLWIVTHQISTILMSVISSVETNMSLAKSVGLRNSMKRTDIFALLILASVATVSVTWFKGMVISYQDLNFLPLGWKNFVHFFYAWDSFISPLGQQSSRLVQGAVPYYGFIYLLQSMGLAQVVIESFLFYVLFFGSGISMYYFYQKITRNTGGSFGALSAALVYMMNTFSLVFIWSYFSAFDYVYAFLPLIMGLFINRLDDGKTSFKQASLVALVWTVTSSAAFGNPTFAVYTWISVALLIIMYQFQHMELKAVMKSFAFSIKIGLLWLLLNAFWILPLLFADLQGEINLANSAVVSKADLMSVVDQNSVSLLNSVRLTGFFLINANVNGDPYYSWGAAMESSFLYLVSLLYPLLLVAGLILYRKNRSALLSVLLLVFGVATCTGNYTPIGKVFNAILLNTGLINLFFITFPRFGLYLALAVSLTAGLCLDKLFAWRRFSFRGLPIPKLLSFLMILLIVPVLNFPFFDGSVIRSAGSIFPSARIEIPQYYNQLSDWMSSFPEDYFVLSLPMSTDGYYFLKWNQGYYGLNPDPWILDRPVLWTQTDNVSSLLVSNLKFGLMPDFARVLTAINVRFVVVHNDTDWRMIEMTRTMVPSSAEQLNNLLASEPNLRLVASFGNLTVFENTLWRDDSITLFNSIVPETSVNITPTILSNVQGWAALSTAKIYSYSFDDWQPIVRTDGSMSNITISFKTRAECPYTFPSYAGEALNAFNATLLYVKTGSHPLLINNIRLNAPGAYVFGAWWDSGWMGMDTKDVSFPLVLPPNEHAIIGIAENKGSIAIEEITPAAVQFGEPSGQKLEGVKQGLAAIVSGNASILSYSRVSPVDFKINVNANGPFELALLQSYSSGWIMTTNSSNSVDYPHENIASYANGWKVEEAGNYSISIHQKAQDALNFGAAITIAIALLAVFSFAINSDWIKVRLNSLFRRYKKSILKVN